MRSPPASVRSKLPTARPQSARRTDEDSAKCPLYRNGRGNAPACVAGVHSFVVPPRATARAPVPRPKQPPPSRGPIGARIEMRAHAFDPRVVTIEAGEAVTFVNVSPEDKWPASNPHPRAHPLSRLRCGEKHHPRRLVVLHVHPSRSLCVPRPPLARHGRRDRRPLTVRDARLSCRDEARTCLELLHAELAEIFTAGYEGYFTPLVVDEAAFRYMSTLWDDDLDASRVAVVEGKRPGSASSRSAASVAGSAVWASPHRTGGRESAKRSCATYSRRLGRAA